MRDVEKLLMTGENPVDGANTQKFFSMETERFLSTSIVHGDSLLPSLDRAARSRKNARDSPHHKNKRTHQLVVANFVHRFEESIGGRLYLIEVASVSQDRWRAGIARMPGMPTALMPFYGRTPDEAARQLADWLTRAHQRAGNAS